MWVAALQCLSLPLLAISGNSGSYFVSCATVSRAYEEDSVHNAAYLELQLAEKKRRKKKRLLCERTKAEKQKGEKK